MLNWKPITEHRVDYDKQKQVSMDRVDMATALALQCGLDPGKIVRTLGGEYTGKWRNVEATLQAVKSVVSISDYYHIKRILTSGCPFELQFEESSASKFDIVRKGNQKVLTKILIRWKRLLIKRTEITTSFHYMIGYVNWVQT